MPRKKAEKLVRQRIAQKVNFEELIQDTIDRTSYQIRHKARACSFTCSKENLLFWAHYADSYRGFCVEYDATVSPIADVLRVHYSNKYPEVELNLPDGTEGLKLLFLTKSKEWEYEKEFRTILVPRDNRDGISPILPKNCIKNIYFGVRMKDKYKKLILQLLEKGPFNPGIWQATLAPSEFRLQFHQLS